MNEKQIEENKSVSMKIKDVDVILILTYLGS